MRKKIIKIILIVGIILFAVIFLSVFCINAYVKSVGGKYIVTADEAVELGNFDCIVVLGCKVRDDGTPSSMLSDRLDCGIELYKSGVSENIIMSGDHGQEEYNEVGVMKNYAVGSGINSNEVYMDHAGFSTYESIYRAKEIFDASKIVIVSQEYHLYRAVFIARELGLDAYGVSCDKTVYAGQSIRNTREIAARFKDFFSVIFTPQPAFLGDKIPLGGNGNLTND